MPRYGQSDDIGIYRGPNIINPQLEHQKREIAAGNTETLHCLCPSCGLNFTVQMPPTRKGGKTKVKCTNCYTEQII